LTNLTVESRRPATGMKTTTVDIADMKVTNNLDDTLVTYSLGSCVGLSLYDTVVGVGGLIHCMLPLSSIDPEKAGVRPYMFVDTGVTALLTTLFGMGAQRQHIVAKVAGAGSPLGQEETFRIGQRNYTILRKLLWKNNILINAEDVGGTKARTMYLYMQDGRTTVKSAGKEVPL
jgi:chemotaxis protein CheD